jgi:phage baseplate assembly protein W
MNVDFPLHFDPRGGTATADDDDHVRDMIEQFLFTSPGERVNRPDFGSGLLQFTIQAGLQRWLGDVIDVQRVEVTSVDATLTVLIQYVVRRTGAQRTDTFSGGGR